MVFGCQSSLTLERLLVWPVWRWSVFSGNLAYSMPWPMTVCCHRSLPKFIHGQKLPGFRISSLVRSHSAWNEYFLDRAFSHPSRCHLLHIRGGLSLGYPWRNDVDRYFGGLFPGPCCCNHRKFTLIHPGRRFPAFALQMRFTHKEVPRGFRIPFGVWVIPPLGAVLCVLLMVTSSKETGIRLAAWMALGQVIYFSYGFWHSKLRLSKQAVSAVAVDASAKHQEGCSIPNEYEPEMTVFNDQKV